MDPGKHLGSATLPFSFFFIILLLERRKGSPFFSSPRADLIFTRLGYLWLDWFSSGGISVPVNCNGWRRETPQERRQKEP